MKIYRPIVVLLIFFTICRSERTALEKHLGLLRSFRELYFNFIGKTSVPGGRPLQRARVERRLQTEVNSDRQFPCNLKNVRSPKPPKSVHKVRPGDIDVVAAMGDSLTAGFGALATQFLHVLVENRGVSWAGGGQATWREYLTLPNIIKVFNPNVFGYALGDSFTAHKDSQFNVAEGLAMSEDLPYMADTLVKRMKRDPRVDIKSHWKLINVMIGSNDFCLEMCYQHPPRSVLDKHRQDLLTAFRLIRDNLPRTIISFVITPNLKVMVEFTGRSPACKTAGYLECGCLFSLNKQPYKEDYYKIMSDLVKRMYQSKDMYQLLDCPDTRTPFSDIVIGREFPDIGTIRQPVKVLLLVYDLRFITSHKKSSTRSSWQKVEEEFATMPEFQTEDFAIVTQPFTTNISFPVLASGLTDFTYLSVDCFHLSQKSYARAANAVWNNLLEPIGKKSTNWDEPFKRFLCPTPERPYISTLGNNHLHAKLNVIG